MYNKTNYTKLITKNNEKTIYYFIKITNIIEKNIIFIIKN